ncbi:MAG: RES family NAD+ phosphorylase [Anaerolineae bacterium]
MLPEPHPLPPADLADRPLPVVAHAGPWVRVHLGRYDAVHFGRAARNRFDAPDGSFGVLYLAADAFCAFVECFGRPTGRRVVAADQLRQYRLAEFRPPRPLRLVDITGEGLARIGADASLCAGPYDVSQAWTRALWAHPEQPEGILYRARHDPSRLCVAAFDRPDVVDLMKGCVRDRGELMAPPLLPLLGVILDLYGIGLV